MTITTKLKTNTLNPYTPSSSNYLNKILKEKIKILNKDKTQIDISGS